MKLEFLLAILYTTAVVCIDTATRDYHDSTEDDDRLFLWQGLFRKANTVLLEMDRITQNLLDLNEREDEQLEMIKKTCKPNPNTWITILRRQDGSVNFYHNWSAYEAGFGDPPNGEFFIGLRKLHEMTTDEPQELMVVLKDWNNETRSAHYDLFEIGGEDEKYVLKALGKYSGDAGDSLQVHKYMKFSTFDQDNDKWSNNCAKCHKSAWWFNNCYDSHLNGPYRKENESKNWGINWFHWNNTPYYSLKFAEMKIRPRTV